MKRVHCLPSHFSAIVENPKYADVVFPFVSGLKAWLVKAWVKQRYHPWHEVAVLASQDIAVKVECVLAVKKDPVNI